MMNVILKKGVGILLSICMVLTLIPALAFAQQGQQTGELNLALTNPKLEFFGETSFTDAPVPQLMVGNEDKTDDLKNSNLFELKVKFKEPGGSFGSEETVQVSDKHFVHVGEYEIIAVGKGAYAGKETNAVIFKITPRTMEARIQSGTSITKPYDASTDVMTQGSDKIALEVDEFSLYGGGKVAFQDVYLTGAKYSGSNVGNDIAITGGTVQYSTLSEQSSDDFSKDFVITAPSDITGSITPKIIEEGDIVVNGLSVTKSYDSSKAPGDATFSGKAYVNGTSNKVEVTGEVTVFVASNVGDRTATVLFNLLSGEGSGNYALKDGAVSKSGISAKITKAAMTYPHTKKNFKVREGQAFFTPDAEILEYFSNNHARGVSNGSGGYEEVSVTPSYFKDPSCSHLLTEDDQRALAPGQTHTVYVKLTPVPQFNENYKDFILPYPIQVTVQPLPQQNLVWDQPIALDNGVYRVKYGDSNIDFRVVNNTSGGGDITYESSEMNIATVNPNTGAITAKNVGRTTVTATAARVDGKYGKTSISYTLEVTKNLSM